MTDRVTNIKVRHNILSKDKKNWLIRLRIFSHRSGFDMYFVYSTTSNLTAQYFVI